MGRRRNKRNGLNPIGFGSRTSRRRPAGSGKSPGARTPGAYCVELGAVRIYADTAAGVHAVLEPLLQVASQKNLADMLGVSTRTLYRWQRKGRVPAAGSHVLAQVVGGLATRTGSG